jgi:hypothetical protein
MSREDREIVLDGQMPVSVVGIETEEQAMAFLSTLMWTEAVARCADSGNAAIEDVVTECEQEFDLFNYEPEVGITFNAVWQDLSVFRRARAAREAEESRRADVESQQRQDDDRRRQRMRRDVATLVTGLTNYGVPRATIVAVLQGDPGAIGDAAVLVRSVASTRENAGRAPSNSHSNVIALLRRSSIPGSEVAQNFLTHWTQDTHRENPARDALAAEADELIRRVQAGDRVSTGVILERLGIASPPDRPGVVRLGQAVDLPDEAIGAEEIAEITAACQQHTDTVFVGTPREGSSHWAQSVARSTFKDALFRLLHEYDGDVAYVASTFAGCMIDYGTANTNRSPDGLSATTAQEMIIAAVALTSTPLDILVPPRLRSRLSIAEEQGNEHAGQTENTPTRQLSEPVGPGDVLGRDGGKPDDSSAPGRTHRRIIRL